MKEKILGKLQLVSIITAVISFWWTIIEFMLLLFKGNPFNYVSLITFVISFAITCFIFAYIIIVVGKDLDNY